MPRCSQVLSQFGGHHPFHTHKQLFACYKCAIGQQRRMDDNNKNKIENERRRRRSSSSSHDSGTANGGNEQKQKMKKVPMPPSSSLVPMQKQPQPLTNKKTTVAIIAAAKEEEDNKIGGNRNRFTNNKNTGGTISSASPLVISAAISSKRFPMIDGGGVRAIGKRFEARTPSPRAKNSSRTTTMKKKVAAEQQKEANTLPTKQQVQATAASNEGNKKSVDDDDQMMSKRQTTPSQEMPGSSLPPTAKPRAGPGKEQEEEEAVVVGKKQQQQQGQRRQNIATNNNKGPPMAMIVATANADDEEQTKKKNAKPPPKVPPKPRKLTAAAVTTPENGKNNSLPSPPPSDAPLHHPSSDAFIPLIANGQNPAEKLADGQQHAERCNHSNPLVADSNNESVGRQQQQQTMIRPSFNRANSIRRPKCKPPTPHRATAGASPNKMKPHIQRVDPMHGNNCCTEGIPSHHQSTTSSPSVRKPSARPPPPPSIACRQQAQMKPRLPSIPPPLPPSTMPQSPLPIATDPLPSSCNSIYEEIEAPNSAKIPSQRQQKFANAASASSSYTPKFRKKGGGGGIDGVVGGRAGEWLQRIVTTRMHRERRKTTQLDVLWTEMPQRQANNDDSTQANGANSMVATPSACIASPPPPPPLNDHQQLPFDSACCSSSPSASSSSLLCRSMFVPSSPANHVHQRWKQQGRRPLDSNGSSNRTRSMFPSELDKLRQNLMNGMGKIRSRMSMALAVPQSSSSTAASAAKTFVHENITRTLARTRSERRMTLGDGGGKGEMAENGRWSQSTFYLEVIDADEDEQHGGKGDCVQGGEEVAGDEEDDDGEHGSSMFGDDWSSTEEEEADGQQLVVHEEQQPQKEQQEQNGQQQMIKKGDHSFFSPLATSELASQPPPPQPRSSSQSLLAEIESEYERIQLQKRLQKEAMDDPNTDLTLKEIDEKTTSLATGTLLSQQSINNNKPDRPVVLTDYEFNVSHEDNVPGGDNNAQLPCCSCTIKLPEKQPLYQIYMLQEQQLQKNGPSSNKITKSNIQSIISTSSVGKDDQVDREPDATDSAYAPDTEQSQSESSAVCSTSIIRRHSSSSTTDSGKADSLPKHSHHPLRRERFLGQSKYGSQRSLWCELPEVKESGVLERMDCEEKKLQEAYFEVITSEASYLRSICFLISNFMFANEMLGTNAGTPQRNCNNNDLVNTNNTTTCSAMITSAERKQLFSNILAIRECSERLLCQLEQRLKINFVLTDICDILCTHFESHFESYIKYCSNQVYQDRTLKKLKTENPSFVACIQRLESNKECQGLDMRSFLMLPMQRITRYPLLLDAILVWLHPDQYQHSVATRARTLANQVVWNCNEGARKMERTEQLLDLESRLIYKYADLKRIPLVSNGRHLVKSGELIQLAEKTHKGPKLVGSKRRGLKARPLAVFLFNDLILIAKRRVNGHFVCKDYAYRRFVVLEPIEPNNLRVPPGVQTILGTARSPHLLFCVLFQNSCGKQIELLLNANSESDRERWISAMRPPTCANPDEKIYPEWDCPQALAVHNYEASQGDELSLCPGDMVNVLRKMSDGWYYGERIRDGKGGWFPSSYVQQIMNDHVRAENYRQRFKIMQSASEYRTGSDQQIKGMANKKRNSAFVTTGRSFPTVSSISIGSSTEMTANKPLLPALSRSSRRPSNPHSFFTP